MATVSIRINQTGQPDGTPGVSRDNIVIGSELQVTDVGNGGGSFSWTYVGPADSSAVPTGLGTNDVRVTPDVAGTYLFFLNHDGETDLSYTKNAIDEWFSSQGGAAVLLADGRRLPTEGETDQFGGWEEAMQANAKLIIRLKEDGNVVTGGPFTELNFDAVGGGRVLISGTGDGAATVTISGSGTAESADALTTASGIVVVATSDPPTVGQALVATSPTEAVWQDVAAGAEVSTSAQGDYIHASLSVDHVNPLNGEDVAFDTAYTQRGDLSVDSAGKFSGLKAGRTYLLTGQLAALDTAAGYITYQWYNLTDAAGFDATVGYALTTTYTGQLSSTPVVTTIFTPTVDSEVSLRVVDNAPAATARAFYSEVTITEIGAVQANVIGGLEYMDTIEVTADTTSVTFGSGGDGVLGRTLDGDVDETYIIETHLPGTTAAHSLHLRPNGISTNQLGARHYGGVSTGGDSLNTTGLRIVDNSGSGYEVGSRVEFHAKTGKNRTLLGQYLQDDGGATNRHIIQVGATWRDTSTVVTSLDIVSTVASQIKAGARFVLFRRTSNNVRADSADTYILTGSDVAVQGTNVEDTPVTLGRTSYGGSVLSTAISLEEAVTGGTVTVRTKVGGVTKQTTVLSTTNTLYNRTTANIGLIPVIAGDKISFTVETSGYTNGAALDSIVVVNITLQNSALIQAPPPAATLRGGLADIPETPHADDDEFESTVLDAAWTVTPAASVSAIDPYASVTTGGPRIALHTDRRPSWLMWQPQSNAQVTYIHKPFTYPTNVFIWTRITFSHRYNTNASNDATIALLLGQSTGGLPDGAQGMVYYINESDGTLQIQTTFTGAGASGGITWTNTLNTGQGPTYEYFGIHKIGTTFHIWAGTSAGSWTWIGSGTHTGTFDRVTLYSQNTSAGAPGSMIMGCDFVRFSESATWLP